MFLPAFITIDICSERQKRFWLWLPVFVLWPILLLLGVFIIPVAALAEVLLAQKGIRPMALMFALVRILGSMSGTTIEVNPKNSGNKGRVKIHIF